MSGPRLSYRDDIGTGLSSTDNTHEIAQRAAPESRVVYVDKDPLVLVHARALLTSAGSGVCDYIDADIRDTGMILQAAAGVLDFSRPAGVCLIMILQFIPDGDDPWAITRTLMNAVPPGSYLAISHPASDVDTELAQALRDLNTAMDGTEALPRRRQDIARFFDGLEMIEPGLVQLHRWRAEPGADTSRALAAYGGVGRKP